MRLLVMRGTWQFYTCLVLNRLGLGYMEQARVGADCIHYFDAIFGAKK